MNIKDTFLKLTSRTYPHGSEDLVIPLLPKGLMTDAFGNLYLEVGKTTTMFTSHLDTATKADCEIKHVFENNLIKTDGTSILGADDKAGVTIMLHMIENKVPGLYYFFLGEEVGCVGSKKLAEYLKKDNIFPHIKKCIAFDRRGTTSVINFQFGTRCCSDAFAKDLASKFNGAVAGLKFEADPTGLYTDSAQFIPIISECTNISVGYQNEHTFNEVQDIEFLQKLADAVIKIDWEALHTERDPAVTEYDESSWYGHYYGGKNHKSYSTNYGNRYDYGNYGTSYKKNDDLYGAYVKPKAKIQNFYDEKNEYVSTIESLNGEITNVTLHSERIKAESVLIQDLFDILNIQCDSYIWDGLELIINYKSGSVTKFTRKKLMDFLPEIDYTDTFTH
jgi:hypothetical protein